MSAVFEARYPGTCGECGHHFPEGTAIRYQGDEVVHDRCPREEERSVCPRCFMERSVSGECGCDP